MELEYKIGERVRVGERANAITGTIQAFAVMEDQLVAIVFIGYIPEDQFVGDTDFRDKYGLYTISYLVVAYDNLRNIGKSN